ncbi:MAG: hypothetical protein JNG90_17125 [Planctomycetaceae bacterium]|nr:hypothetical protein [Planctomycetaceae bacterium]
MNRTAQVNSIDAIDQFRAAFMLFGEEVGQALSAIHTDLQRFQNWLEHDQLKYWQREIRVREERLNEAKGDLHRCLAATIDPNRTPSCYQEKKLVALAKERLEVAERKLAAVRHWVVVVRQAIIDYHARAEPLATAVSADIPRGATELLRTVARLHAYLAAAPPTAAPPEPAAATVPLAGPAARLPAQPAEPPVDEEQGGASDAAVGDEREASQEPAP